ncbi:hypothetical protein EMPS_08313 [Entomortierella parvispora]|uniref:Aminoglycoside phosphotransferase domain-containing protein n=1 Tax=Entomortierella parvispora TaxID=205924 RepID=A0A9P3LZH4_9FUNG|nr:hypothetical protein EMPS_08313 [Entomortierella parvispora]
MTAVATTSTSTTFSAPLTYRYYTLQSVAAQAFATLRRHLASALFSNDLVGGHAPNPGDVELSTPWLKSILISAGAIPKNALISTVECTGLDGNRGLVGAMTRVLVTYTLPSNQDPQSIHMVLKKSRDGQKPRLANILSGHAREAIFYSSDLAKSLLPSTLLPKVYYAHGSQFLGEYVILMEDVKQRRCKDKSEDPHKKPIDINFVFGNQIWGLPESVKSQTLPPATDMLDQMFLTAAEMHAQHWNDSRLLQLNWLKTAAWYRGTGRTRWEWSVQAGIRAWEKGKAMAASGDYNVKYSDKFVKIMDASLNNASWERFQERLHDKTLPFTLTHGDFHAANMILDRTGSSSPTVTIYDWSEVCIWEPTTDLGQTVISDVAAPVFKAHARKALQKYWDRLIALGVVKATDYPFETCWKHFVRGGIEKWLWTFAILCSYPGMPAQGVQYFHDQMLAFMELAENGGEECYEITTVLCFLPPEAQP